MIAIIRLRGCIGVNRRIAFALDLLRLKRVNHCVIIKESKELSGTLKRIRDYTTFGEVSDDVLKKMVEKRGRKVGGNRLDSKDVTKMMKLLGDNKKLVEANFKPVFRLKPPTKGMKSKKKHFPQGDLGDRGKSINDLLERMI
ncbi:MAG: 50S ribosomal protein L30 [Nanoarchaeota archaeon]|nr:50S ribosomal protein L30 [Nanoarchaeota archaeon]